MVVGSQGSVKGSVHEEDDPPCSWGATRARGNKRGQRTTSKPSSTGASTDGSVSVGAFVVEVETLVRGSWIRRVKVDRQSSFVFSSVLFPT